MTLRAPTAGRPLTPKQLRIMDFLAKFIAAHRYSPTLQEIADELGVSNITVLDHLRTLERRGVIHRSRYQSRSIEIVTELAASTSGLVERLLRVAKGEASLQEKAAAIAAAEVLVAGGRA